MTRFSKGNLLAAMFVLLGGIAGATAEPVISLPLDGYYRPGRFFPVQVTSDQPANVRIDIPNGIGSQASGATILRLPAMLLSGNDRSIRVTINGKSTDVPVRALEANQKLLLVSSTDFSTLPKVVLPDASVVGVSVQVGGADNPQLYESADLFGVPEAGVADDSRIAAISSSIGAPLIRLPASAGRTPFRPPPTTMPIFRGPASSVNDPGPYDALAGFDVGRPPLVRRAIGLSMAVFAILTLGVALIGRRWSAFAIAGLAVAWLGIAGAVYAKQSPIVQRMASIRVEVPPTIQYDDWVFRAAIRSTGDQFDSGTGSCRPLFNGQAEQLRMWIEPISSRWPTGTQWRYHYTLSRGQRVGFVCRGGMLSESSPVMTTEPTLFDEIVRRYYQRPGESATVLPYTTTSQETWLIRPTK